MKQSGPGQSPLLSVEGFDQGCQIGKIFFFGWGRGGFFYMLKLLAVKVYIIISKNHLQRPFASLFLLAC